MEIRHQTVLLSVSSAVVCFMGFSICLAIFSASQTWRQQKSRTSKKLNEKYIKNWWKRGRTVKDWLFWLRRKTSTSKGLRDIVFFCCFVDHLLRVSWNIYVFFYYHSHPFQCPSGSFRLNFYSIFENRIKYKYFFKVEKQEQTSQFDGCALLRLIDYRDLV